MQSQLSKKREDALRALGHRHVLAAQSTFPRDGWRSRVLVSRLALVREMARRAGRIE